MKNFIKSIILASSLLCSTVTHTGSYNQNPSTAETIIAGCVGITAGVAILVGLGKLFNWSFYYTIDRTPLRSYVAKLSYQIQTITPYLQDYTTYVEGSHLPLIVNNRYRHAKYPTLEYYGKLTQLSYELHNLEIAFERKKSKNENPLDFAMIDKYIFEVQFVKEKINAFKNIIGESQAYENEYKAKNPVKIEPSVIIIHR
jgi:hypothetical protein